MTNDFDQALAALATDPVVRGYAIRRAGDVAIAEDSISDAYYSIATMADRERIGHLRGYFFSVLRYKIIDNMARRTGRPTRIDLDGYVEWSLEMDMPGEEDGYLDDHTEIEWGNVIIEGFWLPTKPADPIDEQVELRVLCDIWLIRLINYHERFEAAVPKRSRNYAQYRRAIVTVAKQLIWKTIYEQHQGTASNLLKAAYPDWLDEPCVKFSTLQWRMSRAQRDLRELLHKVIRREELT